jgi:DNA-binding winged helix-turn-helix (wHTH) protein
MPPIGPEAFHIGAWFVSQLRKVLGDTESPPTYIETISRKGYRLIALVRPATSAVPAPTDNSGNAGAGVTETPASMTPFNLTTHGITLA